MTTPAAHVLVTGLLALRVGCIDRSVLVGALREWILDKSQSLGDVLIQRGSISVDQRELIEAFVALQLTEHDGDLARVLTALRPSADIESELNDLADADLLTPFQDAAAVESVRNHSSVSDSSTDVEATLTEPVRQKGRFRILRPHAEGGLGTVSVALDEELKREVAFKEVKRQYARDPNARSRFLLEAEITGGLEHPGIVPVYGLGHFQDGRPYYAMRFIRGESLHDAIRHFHERRGRQVPISVASPEALSPQVGEPASPDATTPAPAMNCASFALTMPSPPYESDVEFRALINRFIDVCNAIEYAHSRGVLHRDLKPGNIMLGKFGETLVVDWGLAKVIGHGFRTASDSDGHHEEPDRPLVPAARDALQETVVGSAVGTPAFMSPEQAAGRLHELGPATDVYSLGATLFQVLTGVPPIGALANQQPERLSVSEVLRRVQAGLFLKPREINPDVPRPLEAVCLKAMSRSTQDRYASTRALAIDLEQWLADEPVSACPESFTNHLRRTVRRHQTLAATSVALVLACVLGLVVLLMVVSASNERLAAESRRAYRNYYAAQINLAQRDWENGDIDNIDGRLQQTLAENTGGEDLRGFEWHFWNQQRQRVDLPLKGHTGDVKAMALHPSGNRLATASGDTTAKMWDIASGRVLLTLAGHRGDVNDVAFNRSGTRIATVSEDGTARIWDAILGHEIHVLKGHTNFLVCLAFSPDGTRLVTAGRDTVLRQWDVASGTELFAMPGHTGWVRGVAFSPDGTRIASASADKSIKIWDAKTSQELKSLSGQPKEQQWVTFSPDGTKLASAGEDRKITVWDLATGTQEFSLSGHESTVFNVTFLKDGTQLASASQDQTIKLWDLSSRSELATLRGHSGEVRSLSLSNDGLQLASASWDQTVRIWDLETRQSIRTLDCTLTSSRGLESRTLSAHRHWVAGLAFSPDGTRFASASKDETVKIWDASSGRELRSITAHAGGAYDVSFSPDSLRLASCGCDQTLKVWDVSTGQLLMTLGGNIGWVYATAFSPDGQRLASASADRIARVWDVRTGRELHTLRGHTNEVNGVSFSPDGLRLVTISDDHTSKVWDLASSKEILTYTGHTGPLFGVAFAPSGKVIATAGQDESIRIWNSHTGVDELVLHGHVDDVNRLTFSSDGRRLVSSGDDHTIKIWDMLSGHELLTLKGHAAGVRDAVLSPDTRQIVSASWDRTIKLWDAN